MRSIRQSLLAMHWSKGWSLTKDWSNSLRMASKVSIKLDLASAGVSGHRFFARPYSQVTRPGLEPGTY